MGRDISRLHPRLQGKVAQLQKACEKAGLALGIGECFRSAAEQDALYAQGRTSPGAIVTNAPGSSYSSQHQWGIALGRRLEGFSGPAPPLSAGLGGHPLSAETEIRDL